MERFALRSVRLVCILALGGVLHPAFSQEVAAFQNPVDRLVDLWRKSTRNSAYHMVPHDTWKQAQFRANQVTEGIFSWILLADALPENPFYSQRLIEFYKNDRPCFRLAEMQIVAEGLSDAGEDGAYARDYFFSLQRDFEGGPQLLKGIFYQGTHSYLLSQQYNFLISDPSPVVQEEFAWIKKTLRSFNDLPDSGAANLAELRACETKRLDSIQTFFPWLDFKALEEMAKDYTSSDEQKASLDAFVRSTGAPIPAAHSGAALALHPKLYLRPILGLPEALTNDLLALAEPILKDQGNFLSKESCAKVQPLATIASILGLQVRPAQEKLWKLWAALRVTAFAATSAGIQECAGLLSLIENVTPTLMGLPDLYGLVQISSNYTQGKFDIYSLGDTGTWKAKVSRTLRERSISGSSRQGIPIATFK